jgi:hypothetical protein
MQTQDSIALAQKTGLICINRWGLDLTVDIMVAPGGIYLHV